MRSLLFVPGDDPRKLAKALECEADALILDLEDAVGPARKPQARQFCREILAGPRGRQRLLVRVNALDSGLIDDDLAAVLPAAPDAIVLPKCRNGGDVETLTRRLSPLERTAGVAPLRILPIVTETAASLFGLGSYAESASPRLLAMMWGGEDLAADIGALANRDASRQYTAPYQLARALCLTGAAAAGVPAIDSVYTDFRDAEGLAAEAAQGLRDGFSGKAAIHPGQIATIHDAYRPTPSDIEHALCVVKAFAAEGSTGVAVIDGRMIDRPHLRGAQRVLERARAAGMPLPSR
jgi:citrate lyase subunit beta/citryl-CoA lyase